MGIKRQFIYWVNLDPAIGKEIKKKRPCLVLSSDIFNNNSGLVTIVPLTKLTPKIIRATQVEVLKSDGCVIENSIIKVDQIRTIDASRFAGEIGKLPDEKYNLLKKTLRKHLKL